MAGVFFALVAALAAYDVIRSYHDTVDQTGRDLHAGAVVIAEQTARSLQTIDLVLDHIAKDYRSGRIAALSPNDLHAYLANQTVGLLQIGRIVLDAGRQKIVFRAGDKSPKGALLDLRTVRMVRVK